MWRYIYSEYLPVTKGKGIDTFDKMCDTGLLSQWTLDEIAGATAMSALEEVNCPEENP